MALKTTLDDTKDRLDALLTYANSVTGAEDTSVGDAIETLANGYGQGGGLTPPQWGNVETVDIGENSVTNGNNIESYFRDNCPNFMFAVLKEEPSVNYQALLVSNAIGFLRWRTGNKIESKQNISNFDARLIEGTHYDVYTYE